MQNKRIFLSPPHMTGREMDFINDAFAKNFIAPLGENVTNFERDIMNFTGAKNACASSSGTAALHLALIAIGIKRGDKVASSGWTFIGSVSAAAHLGCELVFVDSDEESWNADPNLVEECFKREKPKAFILTHLYGQCADLAAIATLCDRYGVALIEDAAESLGATWQGRHTGTIGRAGVYSFNGNKVITTSGGGMLVSDDAAIVKKALFLATQARENQPFYEHFEVGFNYRMSNVLAGIGRGQMTAIADRVAKRREIFDFYRAKLRDLPIAFMPELAGSRANRWLAAITIESGFDRDFSCEYCFEAGAKSPENLRLALEAENIESRPLWKPMRMQRVFAGCKSYDRGVSARLFKKGLCLPSGTAMSEDDLLRVTEAIKKFFS
ncbi:MAG: aminotransferase class I/II-fold pyridoxal phosphate-dependent enzyme [Helicobacteraceae bacterium]|jgi:dTDP-4-amino-4,6-dideoxygalactose transaminase|nr:aminotransferase class I/II-fold pyridoxal phosphate-dependent enzyme [Helicobacteraceae bacterium]